MDSDDRKKKKEAKKKDEAINAAILMPILNDLQSKMESFENIDEGETQGRLLGKRNQ